MFQRLCLECGFYFDSVNPTATMCPDCTKVLDRIFKESAAKLEREKNAKCVCGAHSTINQNLHAHWCNLYK